MQALSRYCGALAVAAAVLLPPVLADAATLSGLTQDADARQDGGVSELSRDNIFVGQSAATEYNAVYVFQLPTLAAGESFGSADFSFRLKDKYGTPAYDADLYGLTRRASPTVLGTDFYDSASANPAGTLIQPTILPRTLANAETPLSTSASGDAALLNYLNAQYANGAGAGQYVFLRFSANTATPNTESGFDIYSAEATTAANRPVITYTVVPEPAAGCVFACGALALLAGRRRA